MPGDGAQIHVGGTSTGENDNRRSVRRFTWRELNKLNEPHNAHVAVRGKVYDVSSFVTKHLGGFEQIAMGAGRDITQLFESYHPLSAQKVLNKFYVGELVGDSELPIFPAEQSKFYRVLKERVDKYFKDNNIDPKINYWIFFRYAFLLMSAVLCWASTMFVYESWVLLILTSLAWGAFTTVYEMTCSHDASHFAITHKPWVWKAIGAIHDFNVGDSILTWTYQHIFGHHVYTNIDGADPDIITASEEAPDFRRIKWRQKWLPVYVYQHIYVPMLYCLLGIKSRMQDFYILFTKKNGKIRMNRIFTSQWVVFFLGKIFYTFYRFIFPAFFMPWPQLLVSNLVSELCLTYWMALSFQLSHVVSEVDWPKPDKDNVIHMDWAEMQVITTQDYATNSWFCTVFTAALNHQTTHHLFPGVNQSYYPKITPIVVQTCKELGIDYHYQGSFREAVGCHINHLKTLGQNAVSKSGDKKES